MNIDRAKVRKQMCSFINANECIDNLTDEVNYTKLAEETACALNLYDEDGNIPEELFDIATEFTMDN